MTVQAVPQVFIALKMGQVFVPPWSVNLVLQALILEHKMQRVLVSLVQSLTFRLVGVTNVIHVLRVNMHQLDLQNVSHWNVQQEQLQMLMLQLQPIVLYVQQEHTVLVDMQVASRLNVPLALSHMKEPKL
jgi:hypothetical protein